MSKIWYPYAQHKNLEEQIRVKSAKGIYLTLDNNYKVIDAVSSWWCVIHGYQHPILDQVVKSQLQQMSHVMLGGITHHAAENLAQRIIEITPNGLNHVFFSDSGSVGIEVALKMVIQYWQNKGLVEKKKFISFKKAYHGDTTGAMAVSDADEGMHQTFKGLLLEHLFADSPSFDIEKDLKKCEKLISKHCNHCAGIIIEPLLQAAGGFNMYPCEFLVGLRNLCNKYNLLLIFDEIATGFGRTGSLFACNKANVCPDVIVLGKALSAGYMGLAATVATTKIFDGFLSDQKNKAFMHGPTFMGNPLACSIALASINLFFKNNYLAKIQKIEQILKDELDNFKHKAIKNTRVLGATGVIELHKEFVDVNKMQKFCLSQGVWIRPFDCYLYTMPAYIITEAELRKICTIMKDCINNY